MCCGNCCSNVKRCTNDFISKCKSTLAAHLKHSEEELEKLIDQQAGVNSIILLQKIAEKDGYISALKLIQSWFSGR